MADVLTIVQGFWPRHKPTPVQSESLARVFYGLSDEQVKAVCGHVFDTRATRKDPDMRALSEQVRLVRRQEAERLRASQHHSEPGGATDWQRRAWVLMRRVEGRSHVDFRGFFVRLYQGRLERAWQVYAAPVWGMSEQDHAMWWWRINGAGVRIDIGQAVGDDPEAVEQALAEILGDVYPPIAAWEAGRPARLRQQDRKARDDDKARRQQFAESGRDRQ